MQYQPVIPISPNPLRRHQSGARAVGAAAYGLAYNYRRLLPPFARADTFKSVTSSKSIT